MHLPADPDAIGQLDDTLLRLREWVEQEERTRISRELHDGIGQSLAALKLNMQLILAATSAGRLPDVALVHEMIDDLDRTSAELRDVVVALRPAFLDAMDLGEAIDWYCTRRRTRSGVQIRMATAGNMSRLAGATKLGIFRIFQESLNNALRHAQAREIDVALAADGSMVRLMVRDDGAGGVDAVDRNKEGFGLVIMNERVEQLGGHLTIVSPPGGGTMVSIEVPLP